MILNALPTCKKNVSVTYNKVNKMNKKKKLNMKQTKRQHRANVSGMNIENSNQQQQQAIGFNPEICSNL